MKAKLVPVVIGPLGAVTPKLEEWLEQIPGTTSELSVQKSAVLATVKILHRTLKLPRPPVDYRRLRKTQISPTGVRRGFLYFILYINIFYI